MVWSPWSNCLLYGETSDIAAAKQASVAIALGSDWSASGTKNLLGELKIAKIVSDHLGGLFSAEELARMATSTPAKMTQWAGHIGSIEAGKAADLLVLGGAAGDPYDQLLRARESDVLLVLIDGRPRLGRKAGFVQVNQNLVVQPGLSYGGIKQSGLGKEASLESMLEHFTHKKTAIINMQ
jgi:5-methylthioadenosine/S-adenosylhomocysteine deaminase